MNISKKSLILALGIALPITMVGCSNDSDQPSKHTQETKQDSPFEQYKKDAKKFSKDEPVNNKKAQDDFSKEVINADGKVLFDSDSYAVGTKARAYMLKLNRVLGENVFIQAKDGGRTDLLIQSDDTEYPRVLSDAKEGEEENVRIEGNKAVLDLPLFVQTSNNRLIFAEELYASGKSDGGKELDELVQKAINQSVGIKSDISDKESVKQEFNAHRDKVLKDGTFSKGIRPDTKDKKYLKEDGNKAFEVAKVIVPAIQKNTNDFKIMNAEIEDTALNETIDSAKTSDLKETVQAGKEIDDMFRTIDERTSRYEPIEDTPEDTTSQNGKTVIGTKSVLETLTQDYFSGR